VTDTIIFSWEECFDAVVAHFAVLDPTVKLHFGWSAPTKVLPSPRIIFVPGDDRSGAVGDLLAASRPGRNPSPVANWDEIFTIYCVVADPARDERKMYHDARVLADRLIVAITTAAGPMGNWSLKSATWDRKQRETNAGAALRMLLTRGSGVLEEPMLEAPADTEALVSYQLTEASEGAETETETITREA